MSNLSNVRKEDLIYAERPDKKIVCYHVDKVFHFNNTVLATNNDKPYIFDRETGKLFGATGIYAKNEEWLMRAI